MVTRERDAGSVINGPRTQPGLETRLAKNMYILRLCGMRRMNTYYITLKAYKNSIWIVV